MHVYYLVICLQLLPSCDSCGFIAVPCTLRDTVLEQNACTVGWLAVAAMCTSLAGMAYEPSMRGQGIQ